MIQVYHRDLGAQKYTETMLRKAVGTSETLAEVLRRLGINHLSGGMHQHIAGRIKRCGIDTSHFLGKGHQRGKHGATRLKAAEILAVCTSGYREKGKRLRRALIEIGRPYRCEECKRGPKWRGKVLILEVNHKNGDWSDNRARNLRFLCPNCHSQMGSGSSGDEISPTH